MPIVVVVVVLVFVVVVVVVAVVFDKLFVYLKQLKIN